MNVNLGFTITLEIVDGFVNNVDDEERWFHTSKGFRTDKISIVHSTNKNRFFKL